jgi:hypothetical protein
MPDEPENLPPPDPPEDEGTLHGQILHHQVSAIVPDHVGSGVLSNGVMILSGQFEIVLDFVMRLGEQQRLAARIVLPHQVGHQFVAALHDNIQNYERRLGPLPALPRPLPEPVEPGIPEERLPAVEGKTNPSPTEGGNQPRDTDSPPEIDEIYRDMKIPDRMLSGRYANAVLIRHSTTEFCFDFITNVYPRSAVNARVFLATPHVMPFLKSLTMSLAPPEPPPFPFTPPIA